MNDTGHPQSTDLNPPLGVAAFSSLKAEDEPWLDQCYVPPIDFPLISGWRSVLTFGEVGSGKTALCLALKREWCPADEKPPLLLVRWPMMVAPTPDLTGTELVYKYIGQVLDVIVRMLLQHLAHYSTDWGQVPVWAHNTLTWFVQRHLQGDLAHHVASLEREVPAESLALLRHMVTASVPDILYPGAPTPLILAELVRALQVINLEGVRILVEGLEPWLGVDERRLVDTLQPFLSALALFEHPRFAYTMLLPAELQSPLWSVGSVVRRRVDTYALRSDPSRLRAIIERRLALAFGETKFPLEQLGPAQVLQMWLKGYGGLSPRGWLKAIEPFVLTYLAEAEKRGKRTPLTESQCLTVQARHPPQLYMNMDTGHVTVGWREVTGLQRAQQALLEYLYHRRGQLCSREKLYRAYLIGVGEQVPDRLFPAEYAGRLDNAIYRLRQAVEPDPAHPILIMTVKGEGFQLNNAW